VQPNIGQFSANRSKVIHQPRLGITDRVRAYSSRIGHGTIAQIRQEAAALDRRFQLLKRSSLYRRPERYRLPARRPEMPLPIPIRSA
jgi:hypothetical protein